MRYLLLFVLMISLSNIQTWGVKPLLKEYGFIHYFYYPWHFLIGVYFYDFLTHYLEIRNAKSWFSKSIYLVFLMVIGVRIYVYHQYQSEQVESLAWIFKKYTVYEELLSLMFSCTGFVYAFYVFVSQHKAYQKVLVYDDLGWLKKILTLGVINYVLWAIALVITLFNNYEFKHAYHPLKLVTTVLIYWLGYEGYSQIKLVRERKQIRNIRSRSIEVSKSMDKYQRVAQKDVDKFYTVEKYVLEKKSFTDANLSLESLAKELSMGTSTLSQLINKCAEKSFSDYVNDLRVQEVKKMLLDPLYQNYTVLAIGLEAGFNSKSTFYATFKKRVGCTPVAYQKNKT
ncbi:AraC-like DNA-binding protein [Wenyingzhuangia heitensis]|uniref:AraC-like DNA-binding protein n=1 Tax=Wenyingzhuangia heitensis TaxID=1487859 RepID=A0ABX0U861_9FLAO|nr:helix-turn-helix domain-containing protein [Wenyingzhuangia heitensis]NIJ43706.1 AraC-like DNA-binding protein [Wenyingzhuangia heitensis]